MKAKKFTTLTNLIFKFSLFILGLVAIQGQPLAQENRPFQTWLAELRNEAVGRGYSEVSIELAFSEIREPVERIVANDRNQAEVVETYTGYLSRRVTEWKQANGRRLMIEHQQLLNEIAAEYGVQPEVDPGSETVA